MTTTDRPTELRDEMLIGRLRVVDCSNPDLVIVSCTACRVRFLVTAKELLSGEVTDCGDPDCQPYRSGVKELLAKSNRQREAQRQLQAQYNKDYRSAKVKQQHYAIHKGIVYYTAAELAEQLGVSISAITTTKRSWKKDGKEIANENGLTDEFVAEVRRWNSVKPCGDDNGYMNTGTSANKIAAKLRVSDTTVRKLAEKYFADTGTTDGVLEFITDHIERKRKKHEKIIGSYGGGRGGLAYGTPYTTAQLATMFNVTRVYLSGLNHHLCKQGRQGDFLNELIRRKGQPETKITTFGQLQETRQ